MPTVIRVSARCSQQQFNSSSHTMKLIGALLLLFIAVTCFGSATSARSYTRSSATNSQQFIYSECSEEFLLVIDEDSEGVALSVLAAVGNNEERVLHLTGQTLSSDTQCGEDGFRCKNFLVIKNTILNSTLVFVPLHNALLLTRFVLNDTGIILEEYHLINLTRFNCTPVASFEVLHSVYTVCLNVEESYLALFEVRLNSESLTRASIIGPLARNYFSIQSSNQISEFKYIELYNFHFIYFAYANYLYYFDPLNYVLNYAGPFHQNCTSVKELVYIGRDTIIGSCREGATIYFDLNYETWTKYQPYSSYGRPYVCPDRSKRLIVFLQGGYVQFNVSETKMIRLELIGNDFVSGECFGDSSGFHFVYIDQQEGTFVLDLTTFNFTQILTKPCFTIDNNLKCAQIQVLDNQYLVVQQWENHENLTGPNNSTAQQTTVFDAQDNFQVVTTISETNRSTSLISIIASNLKSCPSTVPIVPTTEITMATSTAASRSITPTEIIETSEDHISTNLATTSFTDSNEATLILVIAMGVTGLVLIMLLIAVTILIIIIIIFVRHTENKSNSR